jgi:hypothetical protein
MKTRRRRRGIQRDTFSGCPLTHHHTRRCLRICRPGEQGVGSCGRIAPHSVKGRFQQAVLDYNARTEQARRTLRTRLADPVPATSTPLGS